MKKKLFALSLPITIIFPFILVSCAQNNEENKIKEAKKKIQDILISKPVPTLKNTPPSSSEIKLTDYIEINKYDKPASVENIEIEIDSIELPLPKSRDLTIWLKVTSEKFNTIPPLEDYYFVEFSSITGIIKENIQEINNEQLQEFFERRIKEKIRSFGKFINDAILGVGNFNGYGSITIADIKKDPQELNKRLSEENINKDIFRGQQKNITMKYKEFQNENQIIFNFELGDLIFDPGPFTLELDELGERR